MKKIISILLVLLMAFSLVACSNSQDEEDIEENGFFEELEDYEEDKEDINIYDVELKNNECITSDGIKYSKTMKLNGYEFELRCNFDDFVKGTNSVIVEQERYEDFKATGDFIEGFELYIPRENGLKSTYEVTVSKEDVDSEVILRGINIRSDYEYVLGDSMDEENANVFPCGFEFLGVDIDKGNFLDIDKEVLKKAEKYTHDEVGFSKYDSYDLHLSSPIEQYVYDISATQGEGDSVAYTNYVIVTTVSY